MPSLSRRRFFGLVAGAAVAAPALIDELAALQAAYVKPAYDVVGLTFHRNAFAMVWPKIGDTITVRRPVRFVARDGGLAFTRDDFLPVTLATPDDVALYRSQHPERV